MSQSSHLGTQPKTTTGTDGELLIILNELPNCCKSSLNSYKWQILQHCLGLFFADDYQRNAYGHENHHRLLRKELCRHWTHVSSTNSLDHFINTQIIFGSNTVKLFGHITHHSQEWSHSMSRIWMETPRDVNSGSKLDY